MTIIYIFTTRFFYFSEPSCTPQSTDIQSCPSTKTEALTTTNCQLLFEANPTMPITNFFFQPHVLLPSIGKSESTDSTIDVKQSKATSVLRSHTRSPSPPRAVSTQSDIWRTSATPVCRTVSNSSREEQGFDLWAIRRCDAFDEDEDDC